MSTATVTRAYCLGCGKPVGQTPAGHWEDDQDSTVCQPGTVSVPAVLHAPAVTR